MKKLSILFVSVLVLGMSFASCNKDDDEAPASIEGKWNYGRITTTAAGQTSPEVDDIYNNTSGCNKDYIEFKTGGVYSEGTYEKDDNGNCKLTIENGTWVKEGSKLTAKIGEDSFVSEVVSLTGSTLKLKVELVEGSNAFITFILSKA